MNNRKVKKAALLPITESKSQTIYKPLKLKSSLKAAVQFVLAEFN